MNLGIFLTPGDSLQKQSLVGQDERFIRYYLEAYANHFDKVYVFSYEDCNYLNKLPNGVTILPNKYKIPYYIYQFVICFVYADKIRNCSVIRVMQTTGGIPAILAKILFGKPFFITYGFDYSRFAQIEEKSLRSLILKPILNIILSVSDGVIVTSKTNLKILVERYPEKKIHYIPNGVDIRLFKPKKKLNNRYINILSIGRMVKQKNQELLIRAIAKSKYKSRIKLLIIGNGPLKLFLENLALKNKINLEMINSIRHDSLVIYYNRADIFCLPSLAEGSSKVLLEALSCGVPTITSDIVSNKEILDHEFYGFLFCTSRKSLTNKIDYLIDNSIIRKHFNEKGRELILKQFDISKLMIREIRILTYAK